MCAGTTISGLGFVCQGSPWRPTMCGSDLRRSHVSVRNHGNRGSSYCRGIRRTVRPEAANCEIIILSQNHFDRIGLSFTWHFQCGPGSHRNTTCTLIAACVNVDTLQPVWTATCTICQNHFLHVVCLFQADFPPRVAPTSCVCAGTTPSG